MDDITANHAREALDAAEHARRRVADEVGLPRAYWWGMAAGWVALGAIGEFGPPWLTLAATLLFGAGHAYFASRLLRGRNRTGGLQVNTFVAGRRVPALVVGMLIAFVVLTIVVALVLQADGAQHAQVLGSAFTAAIIGFGGPEILTILRRAVRA